MIMNPYCEVRILTELFGVILLMSQLTRAASVASVKRRVFEALLVRPAAARSIDVDTDPAKASKLLEVPHPAAVTRLFVLAPLADLAPRLVPPGWGTTVETAQRRQAARDDTGAVRAIGEWDAVGRRWRPIQPR
jgi:hypothetical protein